MQFLRKWLDFFFLIIWHEKCSKCEVKIGYFANIWICWGNFITRAVHTYSVLSIHIGVCNCTNELEKEILRQSIFVFNYDLTDLILVRELVKTFRSLKVTLICNRFLSIFLQGIHYLLFNKKYENILAGSNDFKNLILWKYKRIFSA